MKSTGDMERGQISSVRHDVVNCLEEAIHLVWRIHPTCLFQ